MHALKISDRRIADTDIVDTVDRPVSAGVEYVKILHILFAGVRVRSIKRRPGAGKRLRLCFNVVHQELPRRHRLSVCLAEQPAFARLYLRQIPAVRRRFLLLDGVLLVDVAKAVDDFPAEYHKSTGGQCLTEFRGDAEPAADIRRRHHQPYLQDPAERSLHPAFQLGGQDNLIPVLWNIAVRDNHWLPVYVDLQIADSDKVNQALSLIRIRLPRMLSGQYIFYGNDFKHADKLLSGAGSNRLRAAPSA